MIFKVVSWFHQTENLSVKLRLIDLIGWTFFFPIIYFADPTWLKPAMVVLGIWLIIFVPPLICR